jgi:hypothetical protein
MAGDTNPNARKSIKAIRKQLTPSAKKDMERKEKVQKDYEGHYNKWRDYDLLVCLFSITGLFLSISSYEYANA